MAILVITDRDLLGDGIERLPTGDDGRGQPAFQIKINYRQNFTVQGDTDLAGAVSVERRVELGKASLEVSDEQSSVQGVYPQAPSLTFETLIVGLTDAFLQLARRRELYGVRRSFFKVPIACDKVGDTDLADQVTLKLNRFGLSAGKNFRVIGLEEQIGDNIATLYLWG